MSALTLEPNKEYAPVAYKKYYDGYDPKLLEDIERQWALCNKKDFKKSTPIKYARLAQLKFKQEIEKEEMSHIAGKVFVKHFEAYKYADLNDIDSFAGLLSRHIDRLTEIVSENFKVIPLSDITLQISWYAREFNRETDSRTKFSEYVNKSSLDYAKTIFRWMNRNTDPVILSLLYGWSVYADNEGKRIFIKMEYKDGYEKRKEEIKQEDINKWKEYQDWKNKRNPYGYGPGAYNGD